MRKFMKDSILEICKTMYEAHKNIKSLIEKKDYESVNIVLGDCQSTAIKLGEVIEQSEGEGFVTVSYLEEYCEELYKVSTSINENYNANKAQKSLDKILIKIENSVKNDIKIKLECILLAYKASMFDSLESVWRTAYNDTENCNVHVIPIPYYDRNPDGSLGEMHYEGAEFPEDVPILHYEQYDLEKMRPDVIYIHNPYDSNNFVTCVDPRFHSDKLAAYTDCLVYIPYFVVDESKSLEKINHYALAPGVINSDYVIVQSEKVRQKYIDVLLPHYGNTIEARRLLENKIIGLGSPKFDAVRRDKPTIESLPEEWQHIIGDANKKIIFFNTHLSLLMAANYEQFFIKLEQVFAFFKSRDDVILLWRPHPLAVSTAKSMNPVAVEPYLRIVEKYKAEKWGIYDDTPHMDRSIALADAYYGSESSVVPVFKETGKPVMIMNIRCDNNKKQEIFRVNPSAFCVVGDDIYMFHSMMNLFVKYNTVLRKTEILGRLEGEAIIEQTLISDIFYNNGHLFLIPCRAKYFYLYDMINNSFTKLGNECTVLEEESFYTSISVNGKLYCMPFKSDYMEVIDCFTQKTKRINMKLIMDHDFEFVNDTCLISDDKIAFVTIDSFINIFDTNTNTITSCYCGDKESEFIRIISYNNDIFVLDQRKRTVYKWIIQTNELQPLINENEFFVMSRNGNDIIIDFQNKYKKYSLSTKTLGNEIMRCQSDYFCSLSSEYSNSICSNESNLSIMFDRYEEILYVKIGSEETKHYVEIDKKSLVESIDCKSQVESEIYGINEFVKICCNNIEHIKGNNVLFGGTIYKYIKDKMNQ